jgi:hypothetical protein
MSGEIVSGQIYMKADMICVRFVTDFKEKEGDFKVQFSQDN